jgi:NitT/TauT family transport system ATP-binding protein
MNVIVATGVRKTFRLKPGQYVTVDGQETDELTVLNGVNLTIRKGEFMTVAGPSGSGKSVLLDIIAGLTLASAGQVTLEGAKVTKPDPRTGYVFQQYALFPWRTALANIEYALEVHGIPKRERTDRAREFLSLFGLSDFADRYPNQLSGGQRQRIALARALLIDPAILILDEATSAVDNETEAAIQRSLARMKGQRTVILVAHRLSTVVHADAIHVMDDGRIIQSGPHDRLVECPGLYRTLWNIQTGHAEMNETV